MWRFSFSNNYQIRKCSLIYIVNFREYFIFIILFFFLSVCTYLSRLFGRSILLYFLWSKKEKDYRFQIFSLFSALKLPFLISLILPVDVRALVRDKIRKWFPVWVDNCWDTLLRRVNEIRKWNSTKNDAESVSTIIVTDSVRFFL